MGKKEKLKELVLNNANLIGSMRLDVVKDFFADPEVDEEDFEMLFESIPEERRAVFEDFLRDNPEMLVGRTRSWWERFSGALDNPESAEQPRK